MHDLSKGNELANRFTLVRKLGAGGAAETWLASDRLTRASVALKILSSNRITAAEFHKEWQTSIRLMHAHIVRVFEFNDDPDGAFYSLQFIDGPDIGVLSGKPAEHSLPPIAAIADALRYTHGKGVVHRDIKASNILLDQNAVPYLTDFGVASHGSGTDSGGSLIAASPQALSGAPAQPADDIFALGGLIYELISGQSPYSSAATATDIKDQVPPTLVSANGVPLPASVQQLVAAMLDKNAAGRPDADTVVETLHTAGFAAASAPAHYVTSSSTSAGEAIEVSEASPAMTRHAAADHLAQTSQGSGIGTRPLLISLAVLLVILFGVVFLLPNTLTTDTSEQGVAGNGEAQDVGQQTGEQRPDVADNNDEPIGRDQRVIDRVATESVLGELLSKIATLEKRAVQRWGGLRFEQTQSVYAEADAAFLARDYTTATAKYREAITLIDPLLDQVNQVFATTFSAANAALEAADTIEALRLFELAVAISPSHSAAQAGYTRARNLDAVLALTDQGFAFEKDLELALAQQSFEKAIALDPEWQPAQNGLQSVLGTMNQMEFDQRMTEGLSSLAEDDFIGARAAFRMAQQLQPGSPEPADGLLQVDQGVRLNQIKRLERTAQTQEKAEQWELAVATYSEILEIDGDLLFAQQGRGRAQQMKALHEQLDAYFGNPDSLSAASTMNNATNLVVNITRMPQIGPHLAEQRDQLSRLLKRAATPLSVQLVSDNVTDVSIYKVAKLGSFQTHQLNLRPGTYVAVGSRPGYRDVRLEFRVAPEVDLEPIVIRCEETI